MFNNRALVSFSGPCKLQCKHCYTFSKSCASKCFDDNLECDALIDSIDDNVDIVYISHDRENFIDEKAGIALANAIFEKKNKSIFIITRCNLSDSCVQELSQLNNKMKERGLILIIAVSVPALKSYDLLEQKDIVATPEERIRVLARLHEKGIKTILMIRPLLPTALIPIEETYQLINLSKYYIDAVVASGIAVNKKILERLGLLDYPFIYMDGNNAEFLIGADVPDIKYVDTEREIKQLFEYCKYNNILCYRHSLDAINGIAN